MPGSLSCPLPDDCEIPPGEMRRRAAAFYADLNRRRTVRAFSDRSIPREVIEDCLRAAGTAPSVAHMQPWHFRRRRPRGQTSHPRACRGGRAHLLRPACLRGVAGCPGAAGHRCEQAFSGDGALLDRRLCATV